MKGSELRDKERKKEILDLFRPKKNGVFIHNSQKRKMKAKHDKRPSKIRAFTLDEIIIFGGDFV